MKKSIFFDIDGTLVGHKFGMDDIPKEVIIELERLRELDYTLFLATGRPLVLVPDELKKYDFDGMILCNGAHVLLGDKDIYLETVDKDDLSSAIQFLDENNSQYVYHTADKIYLKDGYKEIYDFYSRLGMKDSDVISEYKNDEVFEKTLKVEILFDKDKYQNVIDKISKDFQIDTFGAFDSLEFYSKSTSKARGIQRVLEHLHIDVENSYAYGDGTNDIEMIKFVGHGVAMGNAAKELKEVADEVCGHVANNGLALALQKLK